MTSDATTTCPMCGNDTLKHYDQPYHGHVGQVGRKFRFRFIVDVAVQCEKCGWKAKFHQAVRPGA